MNEKISLVHVNVFVNNICDKGCQRCFYPKGFETMPWRTTAKLADWIMKDEITPEFYLFHILGGEPLESFGTVCSLLDRWIQLKKPDAQFLLNKTACIFTNGDLLTETSLQMLKARNVAIIINPTHDPLSVIEEKIGLVKSICGGCSLAIVMDSFNMARISSLTNLAIKYDAHIRTNRFYDGGNDQAYIEEYREAAIKMLRLLLQAEKPMFPNWIIESTAILPSANYGDKISYFAVIDPNGDVRNCSPDLTTKIGNIAVNSLSSLKESLSHTRIGCHHWHTDNLPECQKCQWDFVCQGGCPYTRKLTFGTYDHKSPFCLAFKEIFPLLQNLSDRWKEYISCKSPS